MKKRILAGLLCVLMVTGLIMSSALSETLRYGSQGSQVSQAQVRLKELGYYSGAVDGKFGYATFLAVKAFQTKNGLKVDGVIGEITNMALFAAGAISASGTSGGVATYQRIAYGSEGPAVKTVQSILHSLGYYTSDIEGKFGYSTYQAVVRFQTDKGLVADGVVGPITWAALTGGVVLPPPPPPPPTPTPTTPASKWYKDGDIGPNVLLIQQKLSSLGYYVGEVDDRFGYITYQAVRAFQKVNSLQVDGIVGPVTWGVLFGPNPLPATTVPSPVVLPTPTPTSVAPAPLRLQYGDTGTQVGEVQARLFALGYLANNVVDFKYGYETYTAVRAFQKRNALQMDGIVGPLTWAKLFSSTAVPAVTPAPPAPVTTAPVTTAPDAATFRLQYGYTGDQVAQLQTQLVALGYLPAGSVDSSFGYATYLAVREFQKVNSLQVDGVVGPLTWAALFGAGALPKP